MIKEGYGWLIYKLKTSLKFAAVTKMFNDKCIEQNTTAGIIQMQTKLPLHQLSAMNISKERINILFQAKKYQFHKELMLAWATYNFVKPANRLQVLSQKLWYNSNIKINQKEAIPPEPLSAKPQYCKNIIDIEKRKPLDFQEFKRKFPDSKINFLHLLSIQAAIPKEWYKLLNINGPEANDMQTELNKIKYSKSKWAYKRGISKNTRMDDRVRGKWEKILDREITDVQWGKIMYKVLKVTNATKLRAFQYKINNLALTTNIQLEQWKIKPSDLCMYCKLTQETYLHLFCKCEYVLQKIWYPLKRWLDYFCFIPITIEPYEIIFNEYKGEFDELVNTIILTTKYFIYSRKCMNENLHFQELMSVIAQTKQIEKLAAKRTKTYDKYEKKWLMYDKV